MKNQNKQKRAEYEKELGYRINILTVQNELFNGAGTDLFPQQIKLGKSEEQILIDIVGKLTIPVNSLNTTHPLPTQN